MTSNDQRQPFEVFEAFALIPEDSHVSPVGQAARDIEALARLRSHHKFNQLLRILDHELSIARAACGPLLDPRRSIAELAECEELLLQLLRGDTGQGG